MPRQSVALRAAPPPPARRLAERRQPDASTWLLPLRACVHVDGDTVVVGLTPGLLCLKTAKSDGKSELASSITIYNELLKRDPAIIATLAGTWFMDRKNEVPEGKQNHYVLPIVHWHEGYLAITFNDTYYQLAATPGRHEGVPPLTQAQLDALQAFRDVASSVKLDFWLQPGDLQVVHNHTQVHNRRTARGRGPS